MDKCKKSDVIQVTSPPIQKPPQATTKGQVTIPPTIQHYSNKYHLTLISTTQSNEQSKQIIHLLPPPFLPLGQKQRQWSKTALSPSLLTQISRSIAFWKGIEMLYNSSFEASSRKPW